MTNPTPPPVPKKHGCFFYGCIISVALLLIIGISLGVISYLTVRSIRKMAADYTQPSARELPVTKLSPEELKPLEDRVAVFNSALKAHTNTPPLVLSSKEINALISENPDLKGKFYVTLDGEKIKGEMSVPMDQFSQVPGYEMLHLKGRYLNGGGTFKAAINDGQLSVFVVSLEANGKPAPESFMAGFRAQNLADGFNKGANTNMFQQYESLEVTNSTLIVKAKTP